MDSGVNMVVRRLQGRRDEIVRAIFGRVREDVPDAAGERDAEYVAGLRAAVSAAVDHGLVSIERGDVSSSSPVAIPAVASEQARRAARVGVSLDAVLRRYILGHTLLWDYVMEEAARVGQDGALRDMSRLQASVLDRLVMEVTREYGEEVERASHARAEGRRARGNAIPGALRDPRAHRARACLLYLAEQGERGLSPSNRQIADAIGIEAHAQISKLLTRLHGLGLLEKHPGSPGHPNAWSLSRYGQQISRALRGEISDQADR